MADSKKRKAPDEEAAVTPRKIVHRDFPGSDLSGVKDNFYRELYNKEVDFRSLAKQDADFAAM